MTFVVPVPACSEPAQLALTDQNYSQGILHLYCCPDVKCFGEASIWGRGKIKSCHCTDTAELPLISLTLLFFWPVVESRVAKRLSKVSWYFTEAHARQVRMPMLEPCPCIPATECLNVEVSGLHRSRSSWPSYLKRVSFSSPHTLPPLSSRYRFSWPLEIGGFL